MTRTTQKINNPDRACPECNGFGVTVRLLLSLAALNALAKAGINEPVPTREEDCKACFGTGRRYEGRL